MLALEVF